MNLKRRRITELLYPLPLELCTDRGDNYIEGMALMGGAVRNAMHGMPPNDLDLYFFNEKALLEFISTHNFHAITYINPLLLRSRYTFAPYKKFKTETITKSVDLILQYNKAKTTPWSVESTLEKYDFRNNCAAIIQGSLYADEIIKTDYRITESLVVQYAADSIKFIPRIQHMFELGYKNGFYSVMFYALTLLVNKVFSSNLRDVTEVAIAIGALPRGVEDIIKSSTSTPRYESSILSNACLQSLSRYGSPATLIELEKLINSKLSTITVQQTADLAMDILFNLGLDPKVKPEEYPKLLFDKICAVSGTPSLDFSRNGKEMDLIRSIA